MRTFQVTLKHERANRPSLVRTFEVFCKNERRAINKAKLKAFLKTAVPIRKWTLKFIVE